MDISLSNPFVVLAAAIALLALSRIALGVGDPARGLLRLTVGELSFTEVFGMFLVGYAVGALVSGPPQSGGPPPPPGGRVFIGPFNPLARGGLPVAAGTALAFITILVRVDILSKLSSPQTHKSVAAIIGGEATTVESIPAGGHGQITFRDPGGTLVGIMAAADVDIPKGARVRIVGTKGLNPLVVPEDSVN